jgi:hypothetical protein
MHVQKGTNGVTLQPWPHEPPDDDKSSASLDDLLDGPAKVRPGGRGRHRRSARPSRRSRSAWPRRAEKVLGGWAPTLRTAILVVVILATGLAGVLAVWGAAGGVFVVLLCAVIHRIVTRLDRLPAS